MILSVAFVVFSSPELPARLRLIAIQCPASRKSDCVHFNMVESFIFPQGPKVSE
jgi:hypothetical protein